MFKPYFLISVIFLGLAFFVGYFIVQAANSENAITTVTSAVESQTAPVNTAESDYFYPMTNYFDRITVREFGRKVSAKDNQKLPCGSRFSGLHDADDLEILSGEEEVEVPVFAVTAGKILRKEGVEGYGGLLVQSAKLEGNPVTIYYGHVDLSSVSKKVGDEVSGGEVIANLGNGCSAETDGERKHLHFAIKKGTGVDVRGYVPSADVLAAWLDPGETLKSLKASPKAR